MTDTQHSDGANTTGVAIQKMLCSGRTLSLAPEPAPTETGLEVNYGTDTVTIDPHDCTPDELITGIILAVHALNEGPATGKSYLRAV